jgi:hypothetical protein
MTVTIMEFFPLIVVVLMSSALGNAKGNPTIKLTSNAPAILDAQISFKAELLDADGYQGPFFFKWSKLLFFVFCFLEVLLSILIFFL